MSGRAGEASDRHRRNSEHDLYRYPDVIKGVASRLLKVHDIYGLGIILVEIYGWQRIDGNLKMAREDPQATMIVSSNARGSLFDVDHLNDVDIFAPEEHADLVKMCLDCGEELGVWGGADETNGDVGAWMLEASSEDVVKCLGYQYPRNLGKGCGHLSAVL